MKLSKPIILLLVVAIIGTAIAAGVGIYMNRPATVMQTSVYGLLTEVFERQEFEVVTNLVNSGSAEIIMSLSDGENEASLEYKEYFGLAKNETYVEKLKFSANDFSVSGSLYVGEDYMYVSLPDVYSSAVGISRGKLEKQFESSIFAFESESDYELSEEISDMIKIFCRAYDDAHDKKVSEDIEKLTTDYVKLILDSVAKHAEIEKENDTVKINGDQVGARVITIEIDAECIYNVLVDLYEKLEKDKDIPKLVKKYANLIDGYVEGTSYEGMLQEQLGEDADDKLVDAVLEAYDTMLDELDDMLSEMEDSIDDMDNFKVVIELATKKASSELMAMNVTVKAEGEKMEIFDLQIGKDGIKNTEKITLEIMNEIKAQFKIKQNDRKGYEAVIEIGEEDEVIELFAKINKADEKFEFGATAANGETYAIKGAYTAKGKTHTFDFKDVVYTDAAGEKTSMIDMILGSAENIGIEFELKLIICEKDKPKPIAKGKVKSVFEIDEDDIDDIQIAIEELVAMAEDAFESFSGVGIEGEATPEDPFADNDVEYPMYGEEAGK